MTTFDIVAPLLVASSVVLAAGPTLLKIMRPKRFRRRSRQLFDTISAVAFLAEYIGGTAAAFVVSNWVAIVVLAYQVYGASAARRDARRAQADAKAKANAGVQDRSVTLLQAIPPWRIVHGECVTGGDIVAVFTSDKVGRSSNGTAYTKYDAYKHIVIHVASHQCNAIGEIYIEGVPLSFLDANGWVTGGDFSIQKTISETFDIATAGVVVMPYPITVQVAMLGTRIVDGDYTITGLYTLTGGGTIITNTSGQQLTMSLTYTFVEPHVNIQKHLGTTTQTVDTFLNAKFPVEWDASHRLRGLAYVVLTVDLENPRFLGGPPNPTFTVQGMLQYDPRSGTTFYNKNNALAINNFLTSPWGPGALQSEINDPATIAAANACDALQTYLDWGTVVYGESWDVAGDLKGWTATNGTITATGGALSLVGTGAIPLIISSAMVVPGAANTAIRLRIKRVAGTGWTGNCYYTTSGHGDSASFYKAFAQPTYDPVTGYGEATLDMTVLTVGGTDWIASSILRIRLDLGVTAADQFLIDWVAIGPMQNRMFTCNGVFTTDQSRESILEDLCESMMGYAVYGADWRIIAGTWTTTVMDLVDDDLDGMIEIVQSDTPFEQLFNGVRGTIIPSNKSSPIEFDTYINGTYLTDDGQPLWSSLSLPFTESSSRARNLARIYMERARNGQMLKYPAKLRAWPLQVGDRVRVTNAEYGLALKYYRVTDWGFAINSQVILTLEEDAATVYDLADSATKDATPNTQLPNPYLVAAITGLSVASGTNELLRQQDGTVLTRVRVSWTAIADAYITAGQGKIHISWQVVNRDALNTVRMEETPGDSTATYLIGASDGDYLIIGVWAENSLQAVGQKVFTTHVVVGKTAVPATVAGLTATAIPGFIRITWTPGTEADEAAVDIGRGASWAAALGLEGQAAPTKSVAAGLGANSYDWAWPAPGAYVLRARRRDTSGLLSAESVLSITVTESGLSIQSSYLMNASFSPSVIWNFNGSNESWQASGATFTVNPSSITLTSTNTDPFLFTIIGGIAVRGVSNTLVRARVRRLAGSGWDGNCFYATSGHVYAGGFYKNIPDTTSSAWNILEWDMEALSGGGTDWISNTITGIRLDFGATTSDVFEVDWVAIGTKTPAQSETNALYQGAALNSDPGCTDMAFWNFAGSSLSYFTQYITDGAAGTSCIQMNGQSAIYTKPVPASSGKLYRASAYVRWVTTGSNTFWLRLFCQDASGGTLAFNIGVEGVATSSGWTRFQGTISPPSGTRLAYVSIDSNFAGTGNQQVQDVRLEEVINTDLVVPDAISDAAVSAQPANSSISYTAGTQPRVELAGAVGSATYTAPATSGAKVLASWSTQVNLSNSTAGIALGEAVVGVNVTVGGSSVYTKTMRLEGYNGAGNWALFSGSINVTPTAGQAVVVTLSVGRSFTTSGASPAQTISWTDTTINLLPLKR